MENIWDKKWGDYSNNDDASTAQQWGWRGNKNLEYNPLSSGSRWFDLLSDLGSAYGSVSSSNQPQRYYLDTKWLGNGLADTSLKAIENNGYRDPYLMNYLSKQKLRTGMYGPIGKRDNNSFIDRLRDLFGTIKLGNINTDVNSVPGGTTVGDLYSVFTPEWNTGSYA